MRKRQFQPGFRLSAFDVAILIIGGGAAVYAGLLERWFGIAIAFVVLHFFLFCNVLRMSRPLELAWSTVFLALVITSIASDFLSWPWVFGVSLLATLVFAVIEVRRPSYHGVGWRRLNPDLPEWWHAQVGDS